MPGSVYSALAHRLASHPGETYPLHVGDTWMEPAEGCRMEDLHATTYPGMHRYATPQGLPRLLEVAAARIARRSGAPCSPQQMLITTGATGALGAVAGTLLEDGDEVLLAAPYWPLISGIVSSFHGSPVPVPLIGEADSAATAVELFEARRSERTVAIYLNTPNNPTGEILPLDWLEALAAWATKHGLWILADEVYEDYVYDGRQTYLRALAPERTFSVHSFSKAFGMAGNRCGYLAGPSPVMTELRKIGTHSFYSAPTAAQLAGIRALEGAADEWLADAVEQYRQLGRSAAQRLGAPPPRGSTFLFLDVAEHLADRGLEGFLEDCVNQGLFLAPGPRFGPYPTHVRLCFTSVEPQRVARGVEVLAGLLGR
jgi:N-succinyldiaminopimelate aminotransferase